MASYLVETYLSRSSAAGLPEALARVSAAADALSLEGIPVQYLRSIFVPEDEICFHLFEGASSETVREAGRRAELSFDRVVEAIS